MLESRVIKAGIMGATGYSGAELARILRGHGGVAIEMMTSTSQAGKRYGDVIDAFRHTDYILEADDWDAMAERCDAAFLALPHGVAAEKITKAFAGKCAVIDLGADFRLKDIETYKEWYKLEHPAATSNDAAELLNGAVYGLCEINRDQIKTARIIANPGCYTTCSILPLFPLLKAGVIGREGIVIDAKTGISGAGKALLAGSMYCEVSGSVRPYNIGVHRHTPEIEQALAIAAGADVRLTFVPQIAPMERGILACCYAACDDGVTTKTLLDCLNAFYAGEPFVRVLGEGEFPNTKSVYRTNFIDIGACVDGRTGRAIIVAALDNLAKGASGQAAQNMNIMFGFDETRGLSL